MCVCLSMCLCLQSLRVGHQAVLVGSTTTRSRRPTSLCRSRSGKRRSTRCLVGVIWCRSALTVSIYTQNKTPCHKLQDVWQRFPCQLRYLLTKCLLRDLKSDVSSPLCVTLLHNNLLVSHTLQQSARVTHFLMQRL